MDTGEFPGYEFEVPRGPRQGPRRDAGYDSLRQLRYAPQHAQAPRSPVRTASSGVFAVMRGRNWLMGLAAPILAAIAVGVAVVVVAGGSGGAGAAPSALAAGFPPARAAGADFTGSGAGAGARVVLSAVGATAATEVAAGGSNGGPALWVSADGGSAWSRAVLGGPASLTQAGTGQLAAVAHGAAGWLAVGTTRAGTGGPLLVSSPDARTWTVAAGLAGSHGEDVVAAAAAAGSAGYVIVGHQPSATAGTVAAVAWYSAGLTGWTSAAVAASGGSAGASAGQMMNAVAATRRGFTAVGSSGAQPAAWVSAAGRSWRQVSLPAPAGAERAALDYVAASGAAIVAAGTEFTAAGATRPPAGGPAGGGFTATGTYLTRSGPEVVVWTLPPGKPATAGAAWAAVTPQGAGLASTGTENAITALTAEGATLTGVGFTATVAGSGPGAQHPTLWQSPIRY